MNKKEKGQGMVEFALVLPVSMLVILGIVVLFQFFAVLVTSHNAVSEGGRTAQVWRPDGTSTCVDDVTAAVMRINPFFDPASDTVTVSENCLNAGLWGRIPSGNLVDVTVVVNWEPIFFSTLLKDNWEPPTTLPLTTMVSVRHE
jgi:Flp pilus assembly protein TadG